MKIDGRAIADNILASLHVVGTPTLAVIQVGNDEASSIYIAQKIKTATRIGARVIHKQFSKNVSEDELRKIIEQYNDDPSVQGIILQRPLTAVSLCRYIDIKKDVDGFLSGSPYTPPVTAAVIKILEKIEQTPQNVVVIGRGETAGKPIADTLTKHGWTVTVVHSQTKNPKGIIKNAHIVITCVGKQKVITPDMVNKSTILIGVGPGDYDEDEIKDIVRYYTPTPGGVGPVNVACLMQNLVKAYTIQAQ